MSLGKAKLPILSDSLPKLQQPVGEHGNRRLEELAAVIRKPLSATQLREDDVANIGPDIRETYVVRKASTKANAIVNVANWTEHDINRQQWLASETTVAGIDRKEVSDEQPLPEKHSSTSYNSDTQRRTTRRSSPGVKQPSKKHGADPASAKEQHRDVAGFIEQEHDPDRWARGQPTIKDDDESAASDSGEESCHSQQTIRQP